MQTLPTTVSPYKRTAEFSEESVPAGLRAAHQTKAGVWGRIVVVEGELLYKIHGPPSEEHRLSPALSGVVAPEVLHDVTPLGRVRFYVEFLR